MSNLKDIQQIQSLIAKGKGTGFLTFEEVNKALPVEMSTPEQFEEIDRQVSYGKARFWRGNGILLVHEPWQRRPRRAMLPNRSAIGRDTWAYGVFRLYWRPNSLTAGPPRVAQSP